MACHDRHNFRQVVVSGVLGGHNFRDVVPIVARPGAGAPIMKDGERG